nr:uracil-DNA glycosylase family protein [Mycobacterium simiae]
MRGDSLCEQCMAAQEPFFESSGGLLNASFQLAGCAKSDMFLSNVVHCYPRGNRKSHAHEIVNCSAYLHRESELVRPRLIIGLGGDAERVLSFFYPTARRVNWLFEAPGNVRSKAVPCLLFASHPCRVKRQHSEALEDEDVRSLASALRWAIAKGRPPSPTTPGPGPTCGGMICDVIAPDRELDKKQI